MSELNHLISETSGNILSQWASVGIQEAINNIPFGEDDPLYNGVLESIQANSIDKKMTTQELVRSTVQNIFNQIQNNLTGSVQVIIPNVVTGIILSGSEYIAQTGNVVGYLKY